MGLRIRVGFENSCYKMWSWTEAVLQASKIKQGLEPVRYWWKGYLVTKRLLHTWYPVISVIGLLSNM